jgi:hypothetical protein
MKDKEKSASIDEANIEKAERRIARVDAGLEELISGEKVLEELRNRNR